MRSSHPLSMACLCRPVCKDAEFNRLQRDVVRIVVLAVPNMMPRVQVDAGAIKYVFGGANVMCPGITSAGECCVLKALGRSVLPPVVACTALRKAPRQKPCFAYCDTCRNIA